MELDPREILGLLQRNQVKNEGMEILNSLELWGRGSKIAENARMTEATACGFQRAFLYNGTSAHKSKARYGSLRVRSRNWTKSQDWAGSIREESRDFRIS